MAADSSPIKFVVDPNQYLICGICQHVFVDAVISTACGHTFCRACIAAAPGAEGGGGGSVKCPMDGVVCRQDGLIVNRALQGQVDELEIYCRHGLMPHPAGEEQAEHVTDPTGCPEIIKLGARRKHEEDCMYKQVQCPNNEGHCGMFRTPDLEQHLRVCMQVPCVNRELGCEFVGRKDEVNWHVELCGYRPGAKVSPIEVENLKQSNNELRGNLKVLTERVTELESCNKSLTAEVINCLSNYEAMEKAYTEVHAKLERIAKLRMLSSRPSSGAGNVTRTSSMVSLRTSSYMPVETWKMPFQFKCIGTLRGHKGSVFALTTSGNCLVSGGSDKVIKVWDLDALAKGHRDTLAGHSDTILVLTSNDRYLYSTGLDKTIRAWDLHLSSEEFKVENAHSDDVVAMVCTDNFVFTSSFSTIHVWEADRLKKKEAITGLHHWVRSLTLNPDKDRLYSGSHNTIETWDALGEFTLKGKLNHKFGSIHSLAVTSQFIITGTYNQNIQVFDVKTQQHTFTLSGHIGTVTHLQVSPSGRFLFSSSMDTTIQIWNLGNRLHIQNLTRHESGVNVVALHGDLLLSGANDSEVKVFKHFSIS